MIHEVCESLNPTKGDTLDPQLYAGRVILARLLEINEERCETPYC